jgi:predicted transcriptional regulator
MTERELAQMFVEEVRSLIENKVRMQIEEEKPKNDEEEKPKNEVKKLLIKKDDLIFYLVLAFLAGIFTGVAIITILAATSG